MANQKNKNGENIGIGWCDYTANLWWGCTKVHAGCDNCYAEALANRTGNDVWGNDNPRKATKSVWSNFLKWQAIAADKGETHRVFVGSMMDIFEKPMPVMDWNGNLSPFKTDQLRNRFLKEIVPNCPNLIFLLLTKRPSNINKYIPESWKSSSPENVMFGTSISQNTHLDKMLNQLKEVNGKRLVSFEPQLEPIFLFEDDLNGIHWVIQGGESGHNKRPFEIAWAYQMRDDCKTHCVPYFFKQIDKVQPIPEELLIRQFPA